MPPIRRRLRAAAFVISGLAAAGAPALAQNESSASNTIGPPQLKDFTLPGQRTTPPAPTPPTPTATQTPTPPAATPRTPPAATPDPARDRPPAAARPPEAVSRTGTAPVTPAPAPAEAGPPAEATPPVAEAPPLQTAPAPSAEPPATAPAPAPAPEGRGWLLPAAGGALILVLAAFFLLRRRRARSEREEARDAARDEIGGALVASRNTRPEPSAEPAAKPEPEAIAAAPASPRPWIELDIEPERAAATEHEVYVRYALTLTNKGDADAANIRIDPRLFNAGAEGEMMAFFQGPIHDLSGSPHIVIPPGRTLKLNAQVAMPNAELREIELGGRRIFVPMVAVNVAYDWAGGGTGRTSRSWLVGREAETPQEKMGPFRLDLGPRIYRSVGRREARLVMV